ncbi:MAG: 3-oxoacyl-[acyl-carrier-protein] synthase III C-terminal domain-containing protein [Acidobacteriota bacterium]
MPFFLHRFQCLLPSYVTPQAVIHDWLVQAHALLQTDDEQGLVVARLRRAFDRFGCDPTRIAQRFHALEDFTHQDWGRMRIFNLMTRPEGLGLSARMAYFAEVTSEVFAALYADEIVAPEHLIHVTCTGYVAPSAAQRLVASKHWLTTVVTHAYHMGCYAAFPAIRQAVGFLRSDDAVRRCDIVHTELCTLHLNPALHDPEQLVIQSLFADGFVRYTVETQAPDHLHFEVVAMREELLPDSSAAMTWQCADWGFHMTLARDVPQRLAQALPSFVAQLAAKAGYAGDDLRHARFAIHPGGPKIIEQVQAALELDDVQVSASRYVLRTYGNMSSATLPYVWAELLADNKVADGTPVVSLAFGPGLTLCGNFLVKRSAGQVTTARN